MNVFRVFRIEVIKWPPLLFPMTLAAEALNKMQADRMEQKMTEHLAAKRQFHASGQGVAMERMHTMIAAKQFDHMELTSKARPAVKPKPIIKLVEPEPKKVSKLVIKLVEPPKGKKFLQHVGARIKTKKKLDISKSKGSVSREGQNCL